MSLSRQVGRNATVQLAGRLATSLLAFGVTALVLPRQLGESEFGVVAFYLTFYQFFASALDFGAGTIVVRDASRQRERAGRLIGALISLKARIALLAFAVMVAAALVFDGAGTRTLIVILASLHLLAHAPAGAAAIFHIDMDFRWSMGAQVLGQTAWAAGTLVLVAMRVEAPAPYLLAYALLPMVNGGLVYLWARRRVDIAHDITRAERTALWHEAWPAGVGVVMAATYFSLDTIMLRPLAGEVAVAHYSAAYRIMTFALMLPVLFSQVIFPVFSRLWAGRAGASPGDPLLVVFRRATRFLVGLGILFPATVPQVSREVLSIVYPSGYAAGAAALGILSGAIVCVFVAYPHVMMLLAAGLQRTMMVVATAGAVLNVGLNLWWIPWLGIEGAAWATLTTEAFIVLASAWQLRQRTGVAVDLTVLLRPLACAVGAAVILAGLLAWLPDSGSLADSWWRLGAGVLVGLLGVLATGVLPLDLGADGGGPPDAGGPPDRGGPPGAGLLAATPEPIA